MIEDYLMTDKNEETRNGFTINSSSVIFNEITYTHQEFIEIFLRDPLSIPLLSLVFLEPLKATKKRKDVKDLYELRLTNLFPEQVYNISYLIDIIFKMSEDSFKYIQECNIYEEITDWRRFDPKEDEEDEKDGRLHDS